jgi:addiction module HigA family antidote
MTPKNNLPPVHPGVFLKEILDEVGISQAEFARTVGVSPMRVSHVIKGTRPISAEMALLFGKAFGQTPQYWLNLQAAHDLKTAEEAIGRRLAGIPELRTPKNTLQGPYCGFITQIAAGCTSKHMSSLKNGLFCPGSRRHRRSA